MEPCISSITHSQNEFAFGKSMVHFTIGAWQVKGDILEGLALGTTVIDYAAEVFSYPIIKKHRRLCFRSYYISQFSHRIRPRGGSGLIQTNAKNLWSNISLFHQDAVAGRLVCGQ